MVNGKNMTVTISHMARVPWHSEKLCDVTCTCTEMSASVNERPKIIAAHHTM